MTRIENALRDAIGFVPDMECAELADALGVAHEDCGCSEKECYDCCGRIAAAIAARLMPEGMEWPRFEDGEPVRIWDEVECAGGGIDVARIEFATARVELKNGACSFIARNYGERVERPKPADTQESIEADVPKSPCEYFGFDSKGCGGCPAVEKEYCWGAMVLDLLRRQRELCANEAAR